MELAVADELLVDKLQVQPLEPLGNEMVGTDPGAERTPAEQVPRQEKDRCRTDEQVNVMCLWASITCSAGIEVDQVEADEARGSERALEHLDVEPERKGE